MHLAADPLREQRPKSGPRLGGTGESLAIEVVCNQIFNEPHDVGGMVSHTWALWTRHATCMQREQLGKDPPGLLEEATGRRRAELLGVAFAYRAKVVENRSSGGA